MRILEFTEGLKKVPSSVKCSRILLSLSPFFIAGQIEAQDSPIRPCIDNPMPAERRAGMVSADSATGVLTEDTRNLGVIRVEDLVAVRPGESEDLRAVDTPEDRNQKCGRGIQASFGGLVWLVRECETNIPQYRIVRVDPTPENSTPTQFTYLLRAGQCNLGVWPSLHPDAEQAFAELRGLSESELESLLARVSNAGGDQ